MIIAWLGGIIGPKAAKPFLWGIGILALIALGFTLSRCGSDNTAAEEQAKQSTRTSEAYAEAVANGVAIIDNRAVTESALAEATVAVKEEIGAAASLSDIRSSLITRLCKQPEHAKDAACVR